MENLITIPAPVLSTFEAFVSKVNQRVKLFSYVGAITADKLPSAQQMITDGKLLIKSVEAELESVTRPYKNLKKDIDAQQQVAKDRCAEVVKPMEDAIKKLTEAILAYNKEAQEQQRLAAKALQDQLKVQSGGVYRPENNNSSISIVVPEAPKVKGLKKTVKYVVLEATLVPRGYCTPDDGLIQAAFKAGIREIPGLRIWTEEFIQG